MKNNLKRWIGRAPDISAVLSRFPVPAALMGLFTLGLIFLDDFEREDWFPYVMAGLVLAAYLCVSFIVSRESRGKPRALLFQVIGSAILLVLAFYAQTLRLQPVMAIGAAVLILGNAVLFRQMRDDLRVWDFTHKIWTGAAFATLGSILFTLGVFAIQAALKSLFGLNIDEFLTDYVLPIGLGFLAPLYWLSTIPHANEAPEDLTANPGFVSKAVAFMGTWILSPLTLIYALILAAYGVKIIMQGALPKGEIAALTTPFLIIGSLTWLLLFPPFIRKKVLARIYRKVWFLLSIPAAILLAISVGVRVAEYGLTAERFALILCCIWALGVGVWFTFGPKNRRDIRLIPGFAALLLGIGVIASLNLSHLSQASIAKTNLMAAGIMSADGVIKSKAAIKITDTDAARRAKGALEYLQRNQGHSAIHGFFEGTNEKPTVKDGNFIDFYERLKLEDISLSTRANTYFNYNNPDKVIAFSGTGKIYGSFRWADGNSNSEKEIFITGDTSILTEGSMLKVSKPDVDLNVTFNLMDWLAGLPRQGSEIIVENPRIVLQDTQTHKAELRVNSVTISGESGKWKNINFYVLIAEKPVISMP